MCKLQSVLIAALFGSFLSACAYVTAVPVGKDSPVEGIRIYDMKPLLVVTGNQVTVQLVPNPNKAYALRFGSFLAKHHFKADFNGGFLTKIDSEQDSTEFISFLKDLLKKLPNATNPQGAGISGTNAGAPERFQIYDLVFDDAGNLLGLKPLVGPQQLIKVPPANRIVSQQSAPQPTVVQSSGSLNGPIDTAPGQ
jgi:hypothetical protein